MAKSLKKGYRKLLEEANAVVETIDVERAKALLGDADTLFVDIRDPRELERDGTIPGAMHAPRGMLEFWVDPESPYYKEAFGEGKQLVLFCASAWRSALSAKTLTDMGVERVAHLGGGFTAWKKAELPVEAREKKKPAG